MARTRRILFLFPFFFLLLPSCAVNLSQPGSAFHAPPTVLLPPTSVASTPKETQAIALSQPAPAASETAIPMAAIIPVATATTVAPVTTVASVTTVETAIPLAPTPAPWLTPTPALWLTPTPALWLAPPPAASCGPNPLTARLLEQAQPEAWLDWVKKLSGEIPVRIHDRGVTITSRYTLDMFGSQAGSSAFDFVQQTVLDWYPPEQVEVQSFTAERDEMRTHGKNLILTLPGASLPDEVVILSAHLDSTARPDPHQSPGAEDNASGSSALLEAARLFRGHRFARTIRLIWFTGEEQGLLGSKAYVQSLKDRQALYSISGVVNLDMFGYDSDADGCFEVHAGEMAASRKVGRCFADSVRAYELDPRPFDLLTDAAASGSDHGSFWSAGIGAVEVLENMFDNRQPGGCAQADENPYYHTSQDVADALNPTTAMRVVRAALGTICALAQIEE